MLKTFALISKKKKLFDNDMPLFSTHIHLLNVHLLTSLQSFNMWF